MIKSNELFKRIRAISLNGLASVEPMSTYCKPMWVNPQSIATIIDLASEGSRLAETPLTPAQEHADELLEMVRYLTTNNVSPAYQRIMRELIDKIDPPKPVTLDEAIKVLREVEGCDKQKTFSGLEAARDILKRYDATK